MAYFISPLNKAEALPSGYTRASHLTIRHSGNTYNSCIRGPGGDYVWPIEELFARQKFKPTVQERIARLNPCGHEEGSKIRGYYPSSSRKKCWFDGVSQREYIKRWGTKDGAEVIYKAGRAKFVSRNSYLRGPG